MTTQSINKTMNVDTKKKLEALERILKQKPKATKSNQPTPKFSSRSDVPGRYW